MELIAGLLTLRFSAPKLDQSVQAARVHMALESTVPDVEAMLTVTASVTELTWNADTARYIETPVEQSLPVFSGTVHLLQARQECKFEGAFVVPPRPGIWRVTYDVQIATAQDLAVSVRDASAVFDTNATQTLFTVATYNLWAGVEWPKREDALRRIIHALNPDILCLQELRPATRDLLDNLLPKHQRIDDPFEGWLREGNIYWSTEMFELEEYGAEPVGIIEPLRRLFWARLRRTADGRTLLVATAHFTWSGHAQIPAETNPRLEQAKLTLEALKRLSLPGEPLLFMGDLNEAGAAIEILRAGGLRDSFSSRGIAPVYTHPADPGQANENTILDWQLHQGPIQAVVAEAPTYFFKGIAPSDHKPVVVTYRM